MNETVTVEEAIRKGHRMVNYPIMFIMLGTIALCFFLGTQLRRRLQRWQTQVCADAARFAELDIEARHQLRKRLKRLRYGLEFYGQLSPARRLRNTALKPLQHAQQVLGELNDLALAIDASRADLADNPPAWFALGWLSARQQQLLSNALPVMQRLAAADAAP